MRVSLPLLQTLLLILLGLAAAPVFAQTAPALDTPEKKTAYVIGQDIGQNLKKTNVPVDVETLVQALRDAYAGQPSRLTPEESQQVMMQFQQQMQTQQQAAHDKAAADNAAEGKRFLEANAKKTGVKVLPSGLQYEVVKLGNGKAYPATTDQVKVHYRGTLLNGKEFDSSYKRGEPATFGVTQVIKGWTEALQKMRVGAKWKLFIPSELAYGTHGQGQDIGPNAVLVFEVELLEIVGKPKEQ